MENDDKTLDENTPSDEASDSSSSWEDALKEDGEGDKQTSKDTDEPLDNKERSRLGRRLSKFEEEFGNVKGTLSRLEQMLMMREQEVRQSVNQDLEEEEDLDRILTVRELRELRRKEEDRNQRIVSQYQNDYIKSVKSLYSEDPENHALIEKELLTNVQDYPTWSNRKDAKTDAVANYWKARSKVIETKFKVSSPNVRGGDNKATGVTASNRQSESQRPKVKLDDVSEKFAKAMQMDDEYIQGVFAK
jgi:hypothetical protein